MEQSTRSGIGRHSHPVLSVILATSALTRTTHINLICLLTAPLDTFLSQAIISNLPRHHGDASDEEEGIGPR